MKILKSIGAIVAGILVGAILSLATDALLPKLGVIPRWSESSGDGSFLLATVYRTLYGGLGGYVTAWFAPDRPVLHAVILGILGLVANIAGAVVTWNHVPSLGPHWYPIALVATSLPCSWLGGKVREMQLQSGARARA
jgi:hypothetical protein